MREILVATANRGKLREIRDLLRALPVRLTSLADYWDPVPAIPETGTTFHENAFQKAVWVLERLHGSRKDLGVLADDSGLEVDALNGLPGVRSARFAGEPVDTAANNRKLLALMSGVPAGRRTARFRCAAVLMRSAEDCFEAEGTCEGTIAFSESGTGGFGYDPLFVPEGFSMTFAEMELAGKHAISHRGRALEKVRSYCHETLR
ncbi:MAG: RdgB/HAM1 family non-canonical purine NTP pyrophosphatase [Chitinispirillaceae bacterium]|nr:RdgB/HAM1 family non-canonical purine NTP pyrophosphatase [Chitinispirillaceae bacterium]